MNERVDFEEEIIEDQRRRFFCIVDVSVLAKYLVTSKEGFQKNQEVNNIKSKVETAFYGFLKCKRFIEPEEQRAYKANLLTSEFARRLDRLLQQREFKILNSFNDL